MPLKGSGFMAIWHDIKTEGEPEYKVWHTREHMPERLGVPGFRLGRRWVDWNLAKHRYFTLYEADTIDVFGSEPYRIRVNFTPASGKGTFSARSHALAYEIMLLDGVTSVHIGYADPSVTRIKTTESELRAGTGEDVFDAVVMIDGCGRRELERVMPRVEALVSGKDAGVASKESAVYVLASDEI